MADVTAANYALGLLKLSRISSFDQAGSEAARILNVVYNDLRKEFLRRRWWKFAGKRTILTSDVIGPVFGRKYSYTLPPDCVRLKTVGDFSLTDNEITDSFTIEGRKLLTDQGPSLPIEYTGDVEDFSVWDPAAKRLFAYELAAEIGPDLGASNQRLANINRKREELESDSVQTNAAETSPENYLDADDQDFYGARWYG